MPQIDEEPAASTPPEPAAPAPRVRRGFIVALVVVVVAWAAGLLGAWMGVRLAQDDRAPARVASTLGLVRKLAVMV